MIRRILLILLAGLVVTGSAIVVLRKTYHAGYAAGRQDLRVSLAPRGYNARRSRILGFQAANLPPGGAVVLGDSIVELQIFSTLCGRPVLNAGMSGIKTGELADQAPGILAQAHPSLVILAVGANDLTRSTQTPTDQWRRDYARLLRAVGKTPLMIMGIQPFEQGKIYSGKIDPAGRRIENVLLPQIASAAGAIYVPPLSSADGLTSDGVHPNREGARHWQASVEAACPKLGQARGG